MADDFEKWYSENGYYHDTVSERKELMREALFLERNRYLQALQIISKGQRLRTSDNGKKRIMHYDSYESLQGIAKAALQEEEQGRRGSDE